MLQSESPECDPTAGWSDTLLIRPFILITSSQEAFTWVLRKGVCKVAVIFEHCQLRHLGKDLGWARLEEGAPQRWVSIYMRLSGSGQWELWACWVWPICSSGYKRRGDRFLASVIFTLPLRLSHLTSGPSWVSLVMGKASQLGISIGLFGVDS